jgi:ferrochelatase
LKVPKVSDILPENTAVLLLAYGGPDSLEDVPAYLFDIRGGRETPQKLVDEVTERYKLIGGRSPLLEITRSVANKLQGQLDMPVYIGMRHWKPFISDVVGQMDAGGVSHIVAICMAPHYSDLSIGKYRQKLEEALVGRNITLSFVESWYRQPDYVGGLAANVRKTILRWPIQKRDEVQIIFTAHSLPQSILEKGDPYDRQLRETAGLLAEELDLPGDRWTFSYQSAARTPVPWLGPQIEEHIVELAGAGHQDLLIAPVGFVSDHVEVLYDIDIRVAQIAHQHNLRVERTPMLNDSAPLIEALAELYRATLEPVT